MASFYVENFGCRATQADGAAIERQLRERGLTAAPTPGEAEIVVVNSCTVTASADQDARAAIRRIGRENPGCEIVVTGCYAQRAPEEVAALPGVSRVIGNSHKHQLAEIVANSLPNISAPPKPARGFVSLSSLTSDSHSRVLVSDIFAHTELLAAPVFDHTWTGANHNRTRPNVKVQDGCDNRCSFCVIPFVRGQSRSLPISRILDEVKTLIGAGYREVVISGINLGRWGRDLPQPRGLGLEVLIRMILSETALEKLRISSVEPMDWSSELITSMATSSRIAKHAHVPLQSGSDHILRSMHRKHRPWHYREKIENLRAAMPTAAIGADVMVGFPGETDADFEETRLLIEELPLTYLHVFTYSSRPGTPAAAMPNQVPSSIARERSRILRNLSEEKKQAFMRAFVGKTVDAITLGVFDGQCTEALTDNYLKLLLTGAHQPNQWVKAQIGQVADGSLLEGNALP